MRQIRLAVIGSHGHIAHWQTLGEDRRLDLSIDVLYAFHARQDLARLRKPPMGKLVTSYVRYAHSPALSALALTLVFLAFAVRVYRLDAIGLEGDEAFSIHAAYSGLSNILRMLSTGEPHPPLYYSFLRVWYPVAGTSEFALRFPSLVANVLTIVFLLKVASFFNWRAAGLVAALLLTLNPYQVWYSQEARMYAPVALFGLMAVYFCLRALRHGSLAHLGLYVVATLLSLYSHYYAGFVLVLLNLLAIVYFHPRGWPRAALIRWIVAQAVIAALFVPWLAVAQRITLSYAAFARGTVDLASLAQESLVRYSLGLSVPEETALAVSLGFLAVAAIGLASSTRSDRAVSWFPLAFIGGYLLLPLALGLAISLVRPMFAARYLMVSAPAYYLVLGLGVVGIYSRSRVLGIATALFLVSAQASSLSNYFHDSTHIKSDFREAAAYIREHARPSDGIVLDGWSQIFQFWYYYTLKTDQPVPSYVFPPNEPDRWRSTGLRLDEIMAKHEGVWLLDYDALAYDPQRVVETHLARNYYPVLSKRIWINRVAYYASKPENPADLSSPGVSFDDTLRLNGVSIGATSVRAGEILHVGLLWQALRETRASYAISWRLVDPRGRIMLQRDAEPASGFNPISTWAAGQEVWDRYGMSVPTYAPPGRYALVIIVHDRSTGKALQPRHGNDLLPGDALTLGAIDVVNELPVASREDAEPAHRASYDFDGLRLEGFDLGRQSFQPGETITIRLFYQATRGITNSRASLRLLTDEGHVVQEQEIHLWPDWSPSGPWPSGRLLATYADVQVPARAATGDYNLALSIGVDGREESTFSTFPSIRIRSRERNYQPPSIARAQAANFGGVIELLGYDLQPPPGQKIRPGQEMKLTLYWRAMAEMAESYKVFTHLVGTDGRIYGQSDAVPLNGKAPTSGWNQGEILADPYQIALRPDAPAGDYSLVLGLYEPRSGDRIPLANAPGDSFTLADLIMSGAPSAVPASGPER